MDWPLTAVLTGMGAGVCAAGVYGVIWARSVPVPKPKAPTFVVQLAPGVDPATFYRESPRLDILPLQPLDPPPPEPSVSPELTEPVAPKAKKSPAAQRPAPEAFGKAVPAPEQKKTASTDFRPAPKAPLAGPVIGVEQWKVVTTSKASMFNLGGHVDRAGIVDDMASPHLKEALQKHKNFGKLPPPLRAHVISAQNIDLNKLAPYRGLLGMEESLMETQGIRFERIARR